MTSLEEYFGPNAGYVADLFDQYLENPASVDAETRAIFDAWKSAPAPSTVVPTPAADALDVSAAAGAAALAQAIRLYGHLGASLDPLGTAPPGDPQLDASSHGIDENLLARLPGSAVGGPVGRTSANAAIAIRRLRALYSHSTGYELAHVQSPAERAWLIEAIEEGRYAPPSDPVDERELLDRLTEVSAFERFLHRAYPGQTRFSVEGVGMMIPMLDELIARAAQGGTRSILLGMAHRGRLNVLTHVLGKPYDQVLGEFEGRGRALRSSPNDTVEGGWAGDVKYHAGGRQEYTEGKATIAVVMVPNPSHLELVDPVVQGMARAADEDRHSAGRPTQDPDAAVAVLIHGDASFMGQGIVAETLNLSGLPGYRTGGTLHLIANNQLGFTTGPSEDRSTLYASDLAKGFEIPVVHVNAQDPLACLAAVRLAVAYRARFGKDFLIDLIGYRRWGHNEGDEPSFTQPAMYETISKLPTVREMFVEDLIARGVVRPDEPAALLKAGLDELQRIREAVLARGVDAAPVPDLQVARNGHDRPAASLLGGGPTLDTLRDLNAALLRFPDGFTLNPKLDRAIQRRRAGFESPDAPIDWGHAETLAFATLLREGVPIRLTGQDAVRGTFSQRHLTFYDAKTGAPFTPLEALPSARASFDVRNSPLSENAALGFEYGYSVQAADTLVLWEGQYGDFINGAQAIIDEFICSGQAKWGMLSGMVLLLPHAWEGQGPDHSSGRLERFLELCAEDNMQVVNCSTAAQYFHLLRRQAASLGERPRPLVVMSPKSLLRHPMAAARAADLAGGAFHPVLDDAHAAARRADIRRLVLCSGKVWTDLEGHKQRAAAESLAVVRLEQFYPFPADELAAIVRAYPHLESVTWLQEEPQNLGAWTFVQGRLRTILPAGIALEYAGRPPMASPSEGWSDAHAAEQRRIIESVLDAIRERGVSHAG
ncbi:MAG: 2-oxoglutarate dehydrogenase E1 component [Chloroflexi bacterium]|nr:2-oxoglutarate dehydrogenase E1 component [Chloroflexota bacterium]